MGTGIFMQQQHVVTVFLGIYSESPASAWHVACHRNVNCLSLHLFPDNAQGLDFANLITSPTVDQDLKLLLTGEVRCFHSIFWRLLCGSYGEFTFYDQWQHDSKRCHPPNDTGSKGGYGCPNGYVCAVPWVVWEPPCTNFMEAKLSKISMRTCSIFPPIVNVDVCPDVVFFFWGGGGSGNF